MKNKRYRFIIRRIRILAVFFLSAGLLPAITIKVTQPVGGQHFLNGTNYLIKWTQDGAVPTTGKVFIALRNEASTEVVMPIAESAPNNGEYSWKVPVNLATKKYVIRIRHIGTGSIDDSQFFYIDPHFLVNFPPGERFEETKTYTITWNWVGPKPDASAFDIKIQKDTNGPNYGPWIVIGENVPINGPFTWTVPGNLESFWYDFGFFFKNSDYPYRYYSIWVALLKPHVPAPVKK